MEGNGSKAEFAAADVEFVQVVTDSAVPDFFVVRADCLTQLEAEWLVIQPEVFRADPTKGWEPVGGMGYNRQVFIGSEELATIQVRPEDPATICAISGRGDEAFEVVNMSEASLELVQHRPAPGAEA